MLMPARQVPRLPLASPLFTAMKKSGQRTEVSARPASRVASDAAIKSESTKPPHARYWRRQTAAFPECGGPPQPVRARPQRARRHPGRNSCRDGVAKQGFAMGSLRFALSLIRPNDLLRRKDGMRRRAPRTRPRRPARRKRSGTSAPKSSVATTIYPRRLRRVPDARLPSSRMSWPTRAEQTDIVARCPAPALAAIAKSPPPVSRRRHAGPPMPSGDARPPDAGCRVAACRPIALTGPAGFPKDTGRRSRKPSPAPNNAAVQVPFCPATKLTNTAGVASADMSDPFPGFAICAARDRTRTIRRRASPLGPALGLQRQRRRRSPMIVAGWLQ